VDDDPPIRLTRLPKVARQLRENNESAWTWLPHRRKANRSSPRHDHPIPADARPRRCHAATDATESELAALSALPRPVEPVVRRLTCELAAGHPGRHVAFAVAADDGERWMWVRWSLWSRELVEINPCASVSTDPAPRDSCFLPHGHTGPHSFEIK
jgi:hypothetical protein